MINQLFVFIGILILHVIGFSQTIPQIKISGMVTSLIDTKPLANITVSIKNDSIKATTDSKGKYVLVVKNKNEITLVFVGEGYETKTVELKKINPKQNQIDVELKSLSNPIELHHNEANYTDTEPHEIIQAFPKQKGMRDNAKIQVMPLGLPLINTHGKVGIFPPPMTYVGSESYAEKNENEFRNTLINPLSTFSIDVDNASYTNIRRMINSGQSIPKDAVRIEEMINFFDYQYPEPKGNEPCSITTEYSTCPWNKEHTLLHIGLKGKNISFENIPPNNLVFLIDVSGSMMAQNKLPLLKESFKFLLKNLREQDRVSIVVYAGETAIKLSGAKGNDKDTILSVINKLEAGGSTAGGDGILLAYDVAKKNFFEKGNNRVILATDGDFNVGISTPSELQTLIEEKRKSGIYLTCLGYGMGNLKDDRLEKLADVGNGNYAYIDNIQEANRVLGKEFAGTVFAVATDMKIQTEFNPTVVQAYKLIGYENRILHEEDFKNDQKDAGELGAGQQVTALYEIIPVGINAKFIALPDSLKYQKKQINPTSTKELATIKIRYKKTVSSSSVEFQSIVVNKSIALEKTSTNFRFSSAVALFGLILSKSKFTELATYQDVLDLAKESKGKDEEGYFAEFIRLVNAYKK